MKSVAFQQVDVFSSEPYRGNPLAVVLDGSGLSTEQMQGLARWTNLSETTFLLPPTQPEADYRVRIFTTIGELPFAGHPTLGSCHAWLCAGGKTKTDLVVQECAAGLIRIRRQTEPQGERLAFAAPPLIRSGPVAQAELVRIQQGLGLESGDVLQAQWCDNGPGWIGLLLRNAQLVLDVVVRAELLKGFKVGLIGAHSPSTQTGVDFEVRAFFPRDGGIFEDPVTGSLNAAFASWLIPAGLASPSYTVSQGTQLGRKGRVFVDALADGKVTNYWIGGYSSTCIEGSIQLPI